MPGKSWRAASDEDLAYSRTKILEEQANAKQADFDDVTFKEHCLGFNLYFLICFTCTAFPCFVHVVLLSEMGAGSKTIEWLSGRQKISMYCAGYVGFLLIMLYLLDFFCPPHLPGRYLTFTKKDRGIRYFILGQLILGAGAAGFFYAKALPYLPTLVTMLTGPVLCGVARELTRPEVPRYTRKSKTTSQAIQMLANMVNDEKDCRNFYAAVMTAFIISGGLTAMAWLLWALNTGHAGGKIFIFKSDSVQEELEAIRRLTPLVGGAANMLLGLITMLRVSLAKDYQDTEDLRVNTIAAMGDDEEPEDDESRQSPERVIANFLKKQGTFEAFQQMDEGHRKTFVRYEMQIMAALFRIMKIIFCCFICLLGCLWVASELLVADSQLAKLLVAFVALIFLCFIAFLFLSFGRLMSSTKDWFLECPLGRMAVGMSSNDWFRAGVSAMVMPVVPPLLLLSMLNQLIRRFRGLYTRIPPRTARAFATQAADAPSGAHGRKRSRATLEIATIEVQVAPQDQLLTERFMEFIDIVMHWNWISVVSKVYLIGFGFVCFQISPKLINIFLSWLSGMLSSGVPFPVTVVVTVVSGIACFLLPPVPGLPVYLFAGSIVAITCPAGFWAGCGIAVAMGMVLKLTACAIQQKCIGEALGSSKWIKSQVGVNKSFFRSVERILRKPGLSFGKVAILCGGPDWPTSVFCGVQHLSLVQCELGTMPILVFIAPCTLYGAFYTRQTESEVWKNATNVMLLVSVATNMFFGLGAAWAVQEELDESHWEVTKPLEEYIDLDWLDYRSEQLAQCCVVTWKDVPVVIRGIAVFFAIVEACVCHLFYQLSSFCFGTFNITDDINTLKVYGSDGLIKLPGAAALGASVFSLIGYFLLSRCVKKKRAGPEAERAKSLDVAEAGWKADREHQARLAQRASIRSVSEMLHRAGSGDRRSTRHSAKFLRQPSAPLPKAEGRMVTPVRRIDKE